MVIKIPCSEHKDCFANTNGYCTCLMNNDFGGRDCPFYKNKSKAEAEREQTRYTLMKKGRTDSDMTPFSMYRSSERQPRNLQKKRRTRSVTEEKRCS